MTGGVEFGHHVLDEGHGSNELAVHNQDSKTYVQYLLAPFSSKEATEQPRTLRRTEKSEHLGLLVNYSSDAKSLGKIVVNGPQNVSMLE